jgi:hypothetical protein
VSYETNIALAQRLIEKKGRQVTFEKLSGTVADATRPWKGAGTPTTEKTVKRKAVFLIHEGRRDLGYFGIDEELLKRVEQIVLVAPGTVDLTDFNSITDGSQRYVVDWQRVLRPGDPTILFVFGVKR